MAGIRKGTRKKNNPEYESVEYVDKSGVKRTKYVKKGNSANSKATADRVKNMDVFVSRESDEDYGDGLENSLATSGLQDMGNGEWNNGSYTFSDVHETDDGRLQAVVNTPDGETSYTLKSEKGGSADLFAQGLANATSLPKTLGAVDSELERNAERTVDGDGTVYVKSTTTLAGGKTYGLRYTYPQEADSPDSYLDFSETFESKRGSLFGGAYLPGEINCKDDREGGLDVKYRIGAIPGDGYEPEKLFAKIANDQKMYEEFQSNVRPTLEQIVYDARERYNKAQA